MDRKSKRRIKKSKIRFYRPKQIPLFKRDEESSLKQAKDYEKLRKGLADFLIFTIQAHYEEIGKTPTRKQFLEENELVKAEYISGLVFRSYNELVIAAGLKVNRASPSKLRLIQKER